MPERIGYDCSQTYSTVFIRLYYSSRTAQPYGESRCRKRKNTLGLGKSNEKINIRVEQSEGEFWQKRQVWKNIEICGKWTIFKYFLNFLALNPKMSFWT